MVVHNSKTGLGYTYAKIFGAVEYINSREEFESETIGDNDEEPHNGE